MKYPYGLVALAATAIALIPLSAHAEIDVSAPWARATAPGAPSAAIFLTIKNTGDTDDSLTGVSTPIADDAMLHQTMTEMTNNGDMSRMEMLDALPLPAGKTQTLAPGGVHIMLEGMHKNLAEAQTFPATLTFAHHEPVTITVHVAAAGANQAP